MLTEIIERKKAELLSRNVGGDEAKLRDQVPQQLPPSFSQALSAPGPNIIAEIKYRSPSHGEFKCRRPPCDVAEEYRANGAAAISILTDETFFGGRLEFLSQVSRHLQGALPLLRKDFLLQPCQVVEARCNGASAYLLIAACLDLMGLRTMIECGEELGMEALVEVHDPRELDLALKAGAGLIGVNNRDLNTFEVNIQTSFRIARLLEGEGGRLLVAESGLSDPVQIAELYDAGFQGFLIGTAFMQSEDPGAKLHRLKQSLKV